MSPSTSPSEYPEKVFVVVKFYGGGGPEYDELKAFKTKEDAEKYENNNEGTYHYFVEELELH